MCGLTGFIDPAGRTSADAGADLARRMAERLAHRGPDDAGVWSDPQAGVFIAHRRLSIVDLSAAGHQPMPSASGRYVMAFNGEVYNHAAIRRELETAGKAPSWRGHSDTEVMLATFEAWGITAALQRFVGMFAIALWDRELRELVLVRDRAGEKPLYWGRCHGAFLFASELKALRAYPGFQPEVDRRALAFYMRHSAVPAPLSIYQDIAKVEPGTLVRIRPERAKIRVETYWSAHDQAVAGQLEPLTHEDAATDELERLIGEAVAQQLEADVPVGAFLSGGIDSSTVVALAQAKSKRPVRTFAIGFEEKAFDEAPYALAVAKHLGTEHNELYVSAKDALAVVPNLPHIYDEPFADASQIPTYLVAQMARRHVTVSLSGDGGDELFAGYTRHLTAEKLRRMGGMLPGASRRMLAQGLLAVQPRVWDGIFTPLGPLMPRALRQRHLGIKLHKLAGVLAANPEDMYQAMVCHWNGGEEVVIGAESASAGSPDLIGAAGRALPSFKSVVEEQAWQDFVDYLPNDILVKVDRAAMAVSLESRVPLLDHRVVEFAWRLPLHMKLRQGVGKWLLRQVLYRYVPRALVERPKSGFAIPLDAWLRGPLRPWAEELLDEARLKREGYFHPAPIRKKWSEHLSGRGNWEYWLWDVLMFQAWLAAS